jgi:uncharacterized membrane protein YfcA
MLPAGVLVVAAGAGVVAGVLIGSVGVGGIIIVPILIQSSAVDVQMAIASAMVSYMAAGLVGMLMYARENSIEWRTTASLLVGAAPAAFAGSFLLQFFSDTAVKLVLYVLMLGSSVLALARTLQGLGSDRKAEADAAAAAATAATVRGTQAVAREVTAGYSVGPAPNLGAIPAPVNGAEGHPVESTQPAGLGLGAAGVCCRLVVGAITGFGSALTGTSGPVVSLPMFLLLRWPITTSLGSAQAVQLPIAAASTLSYIVLRPGVIEWPLAGAIALGLAPCVAVGAVIAHRVPKSTLKLTVATVLVVSAVVLIAKLVLEKLVGAESDGSSSQGADPSE